jgi:hypothetical protein
MIHLPTYLLVYHVYQGVSVQASNINSHFKTKTFHCRPAHQQTHYSSLFSSSLQWFRSTCCQFSKDRSRMQQTPYEMIQLYHSKWCSMSKYRQKVSTQSHPSKVTITMPLIACSIQHFCKHREFVGIHIYIYIGGHITDRIEFVEQAAVQHV